LSIKNLISFMFKKNILLPLLSILIVAGIVATGIYFYQRNDSEKNKTEPKNSEIAENKNPEKISIYTSFYPLQNFTKNIGGDLVEVTSIVPPGAEPHDYEPTSQQIQKIGKAKLFIFNGADLDPWAKKIQPDLEKENVKTLEISANFQLLKAPEGEEGEFDPHLWLNPPFVKKQSELIKKQLIQIDPKNSDIYTKNYSSFFKKLDDLDAEFRLKLKECKQKKIITSHNAFSYLGNEYGFEPVPINGITPDKEPSSQEIAEIVKIVKENGIKVVFTATLVSPKLSETIAKETGAKNLVLDPIEGLSDEDMKSGKDYISIMRENLAKIAEALECK